VLPVNQSCPSASLPGQFLVAAARGIVIEAALKISQFRDQLADAERRQCIRRGRALGRGRRLIGLVIHNAVLFPGSRMPESTKTLARLTFRVRRAGSLIVTGSWRLAGLERRSRGHHHRTARSGQVAMAPLNLALELV